MSAHPVIRPLRVDDAPALAALVRANRAFLAPYEPERHESYFTEAGQRALLAAGLAEQEHGERLLRGVLDRDGRLVGRITLNEIVRGPLQSANLGYWVAEEAGGRGLATAAARAIITEAFDVLGLHRLQAGTLLDNVRSQRVLEHVGFTRIGIAAQYLRIAGRWQDHALYQLLASSS